MSEPSVDADELTSAEVEDLYRRYGFFLRRRCGLVLRDKALVEDAMQEAFVRVMRSGAVLRGMDHPLRWMQRVVDRCAIDQLRRGKRLLTADSLEDREDQVGAHPSTSIELRDAVLGMLGELDDTERSICILAFVDGLTQGEIAQEVGLSRVTVNKKVQHIREHAERVLGGAS